MPGFSARPGADACLLDRLQRAVRVQVGFEMEAEQIGAGVAERCDPVVRAYHHQVDVEWQCGGAANGAHHRRPERQVGHELTVHHVDVDPVGAARGGRLHLIRQVAEIGVQNRWRELDRHATAARRRFSASRS